MVADLGVTSSGRAAEPERRQVTALYYDLVGSTLLASKLDPEDFRNIRQQFHEICSNAAMRYGGYVNGYSGDGAMVYFGYPGIHEDGPESAIRAGLDIVAGCRVLNEMPESEELAIGVRVGIATGLVVAGGLPNEAAIGYDNIIGLAPNLANKVQARAAANTVTVTESTYDLVKSLFHMTALPSVQLQEGTEPVHVWQVVKLRRFRTRFQATRSFMTTPLISRENELKVISGKWRSACDGNGQTLLISGEAGIGKSRLLVAAINHLDVPKQARLIMQCSFHHQNSPFFPVIDLFKKLLRIETNTSADEIVRRVFQFIPARKDDLTWTMPYLRLLLGEQESDFELGDDVNPEILKERTLSSLIAIITAMVEAYPIIFAVEDAHWVDATTKEFIELLIEKSGSLRLLDFITYRPGYSFSAPQSENVLVLNLTRLSANESAKVIGHVSSQLELDGKVISDIIKMADGVPLFLEELCNSLIKQASQQRANPKSTAKRKFEIPSSLSDLLGSRLDQMGPRRDVVQIASAIGTDFSAELLQRVSPTTPEQTEAALNQMVTLGLAMAHGTETQLAYTFKHALLQEAAYASMMNSTRKAVHQRIAECLKHDLDAKIDVSPEVLAYHYEKSEQIDKAIASLMEAGRLAALRSANVEALNLYEQALALNGTLPGKATRDATELSLLVAAGPLRISVNGPGAPTTQSGYQRAVELCEKLPNGPSHFPAMWGWWRVSPNFRITQERADKLSRQMSGVDDDNLHLQAHHCQWATHFNLGNQQECCRHIEQGLRIYDSGDYNAHGILYGGHDPKVCAIGEKSLSLWLLGYPDQSLRAAEECLREADRIAHKGTTAHARDIEIMVHRYRRDAHTVLHRANGIQDFADQTSSRDLAAKASIFRGWALGQLGDPENGVSTIETGLAAQRKIGTQEDFPVFHEMLAETYGLMNQPLPGLQLIEEAITIAEDTGLLYWSAEIYRRKGELLLQVSDGNRMVALACFEKALETANAQHTKSLQLRVAMSLVRHGFAEVGGTPSTDLLHDTVKFFSEGFDTPDLQQARGLCGL